MDIDEILADLPVDQIADRLGVDRATAGQAIELALPALVGGMQANAGDKAGAASLAQALGQHDDGLMDAVQNGQRSVNEVDTEDGGKIVSHVFGDRQDRVVSTLGGVSGASETLMSRLLPMLAPLVMPYLAKKVLGGGRVEAGGSRAGGGTAGGIDLGDLLGQVLGGGSRGGGLGRSPSGVDLGDLLGGLLGGGRR